MAEAQPTNLGLNKDSGLVFDWRPWAKRSLVALGPIMALYLGAGVWAVRGDLIHALQRLPVQVLPKVLGLVFLGWGLRALRWCYYVRRLGWQVPLRDSLLAFFASFAFTATPGKAGEGVKSVLLRTRYNVPLTEGFAVLMVERLGDLAAVAVLAACGLSLMVNAWVFIVLAGVLVGAMTLFASHRSIYQPLLSPLGRWSKLSGVVEKVLRLLDTGATLLRPTPFLVDFGIALIFWTCEGLALDVLLRAFGISGHLLTSCSIFGLATLVGALSALPGGVGSFEVVMVFLLSRTGMAVSAATVPVILFRFSTLWLTSFLGLGFLLTWLTTHTNSKNSKVSS